MGPATIGIHAGYDADPSSGATAVPLVQSSAFAHPSARSLADIFAGRAPGQVYSRISNPTNMALERRLAALDGGLGALVTASGMAAITAVLLALTGAGQRLVTTTGIFGGTVSLCRRVLRRCGIETVMVEPDDPQAMAAAISEGAALVFVETITNPTIAVPDIPAIAALCRQAGIPLVLDATATTPILARGCDLGADVVIHSTTKFINGNGTAIGGAIIDCGRFDWSRAANPDLAGVAARAGEWALLSYLRNVILRDTGACAAPANSLLMLQGLETLELRMPRHCANAQALAEVLTERPEVAWVAYPGLSSSPNHARSRAQFGGQHGAIIAFGLHPDRDPWRWLDALAMVKRMTNLGDARTMALHPASTIFAEYPPQERIALGVGDDMLRIAVGREDIDDIIGDVVQALEHSQTDTTQQAPGAVQPKITGA